MVSPVGTLRPISQGAMADALKGAVWVMQIESKWYEMEFTGDVSQDDQLLVTVKKPTKAPGGHHV